MIETSAERPRPFVFPDYCKGCGRCIDACPKHCISHGSEINPATGLIPIVLDLEACNGWGLPPRPTMGEKCRCSWRFGPHHAGNRAHRPRFVTRRHQLENACTRRFWHRTFVQRGRVWAEKWRSG